MTFADDYRTARARGGLIRTTRHHSSSSEEGALILHMRYQADIWVEVDTDADDVVQVVVDEATMVRPHAVLVSTGQLASSAAREAAERIADSSEWPSWDYGQRLA